MDAMENGTFPPVAGSNQDGSADGFRLKTFLDQNILKLKLNQKKYDEELDPKSNFDSTARNDVKLSSNYGSKVLNNGYNSYMDMGSNKEEEEESDFKFRGGYPIKVSPVVEIKAKKLRNLFGGANHGFDVDNGSNLRSSMSEEMLPPVLRAKKFPKVDRKVSLGFDGESNGNGFSDGYWVNVGSDRNSVPGPGTTRNKYIGNVEAGLDSRSLSRSGAAEKAKRGRDPLEEMVSSIRVLGEGFMKMEKMKMDMAREMEKMRMEMEMKRNELILESQKQIVEAFLKGFMEMKNKKSKTTTVAPPSES